MTYSVLMPDYNKAFSCTGGACAYTCCQGWQIDLSRADYNKIRSAKKSKSLEAAIKEGMKRRKEGEDKRYAYFTTSKQVCAMLCEDGLCKLQAECGAQVLPSTCRMFPRMMVMGGDVVLRACTAGCSEVMKELALRERPLTFVVEQETWMSTGLKNFIALKKNVHPLVRKYSAVLEVCVDILQNRAAMLGNRIVVLGMALGALPALEQYEQEMGIQEQKFDEWSDKYATMGQKPICLQNIAQEKAAMSNLTFIQRLQRACSNTFFDEIAQRIFTTFSVSYEQEKEGSAQGAAQTMKLDLSAYAQMRADLYQACNVEAMLENIMVNYMVTCGVPFAGEDIWKEYLYFCQLYSYLHFVAVSCYAQQTGLQKLICDLTVCYRYMVHSPTIKDATVVHLQENDCTTLAHMAILVSG